MIHKELNILMVDDNEDDVLLSSKALTKFDNRFKVECVSNGDDCLKKLASSRYNVLLLDYSLPGMDGLGVLNSVLKYGHEIPIIMVTGQGNEEIAVQSMKKGAYDYIIKSDNYRQILPVVIQKVIEKFALDKMKEQLEEETLDKKSKLEATLNSTSDGILMVSYSDNDKNFISIVNKRFEEIFNIPVNVETENALTIEDLNEKLGQQWSYSSGETSCFIEKFEDNAIEKVDIVENSKTRSQVVERYTGPVFDENRNIIGRIWSFRDVTKRIELEKKLKRLSITDNLTKLYNQGHFYEVLEKEVERARRLGHNLSLILFDIDKFKEYNDTYGHQKGDKVLEKIGEIVLAFIRENVDTAYRYGGDEFTVILPETNLLQAKTVAERVRESFEACGYSTLSLGLIAFDPSYTAEDLVRYADKAMYLSKKAGGNKVSQWVK